jgi:hypothetical protein
MPQFARSLVIHSSTRTVGRQVVVTDNERQRHDIAQIEYLRDPPPATRGGSDDHQPAISRITEFGDRTLALRIAAISRLPHCWCTDFAGSWATRGVRVRSGDGYEFRRFVPTRPAAATRSRARGAAGL